MSFMNMDEFLQNISNMGNDPDSFSESEISNGQEPVGQPIDFDNDGVIDAIGIDTTGDGIIDTIKYDFDHDGIVDAIGHDTSGDGNIDTITYIQNSGEIDNLPAEAPFDFLGLNDNETDWAKQALENENMSPEMVRDNISFGASVTCWGGRKVCLGCAGVLIDAKIGCQTGACTGGKRI